MRSNGENEIATRLQVVRERIERPRAALIATRPRFASCSPARRKPPAAIRAAYEAGARDFGENYVQEALSKRAELTDLADIRWHLIGHLQSNKAKLAASAFTLIHSIDSVRLARRARARGFVTRSAVSSK